jgi:hypothetical protein
MSAAVLSVTETSEHDELQRHRARRIDELRNEGEEERRRLGIERLDDDASRNARRAGSADAELAPNTRASRIVLMPSQTDRARRRISAP